LVEGWPPLLSIEKATGDRMATSQFVLKRGLGGRMATSPFYRKANGDGLATCPFHRKGYGKGDEMATSPDYLKGISPFDLKGERRWDGHLAIPSRGEWWRDCHLTSLSLSKRRIVIGWPPCNSFKKR